MAYSYGDSVYLYAPKKIQISNAVVIACTVAYALFGIIFVSYRLAIAKLSPVATPTSATAAAEKVLGASTAASNSTITSQKQEATAVLAASGGIQTGALAPQAVQDYVKAWASSHAGQKWAVAVTSLDSGWMYQQNADQDFEMASIYKLFLASVLAQKVPSAAWANTNVPELTPARTYQQCVTAMIQVSDNNCAEKIADRIGWGFLDKKIRAAGYTHTKLNRTDYLSGTAGDSLRIVMDFFSTNSGIDTTTKQVVTNAMFTQKLRSGIPAGCPTCKVANKTGDIKSLHHDVAYLEVNGKHYGLAIFSDGATWPQVAQFTNGLVSHL